MLTTIRAYRPKENKILSALLQARRFVKFLLSFRSNKSEINIVIVSLYTTYGVKEMGSEFVESQLSATIYTLLNRHPCLRLLDLYTVCP